jgi:hypothetical protein
MDAEQPPQPTDGLPPAPKRSRLQRVWVRVRRGIGLASSVAALAAVVVPKQIGVVVAVGASLAVLVEIALGDAAEERET